MAPSIPEAPKKVGEEPRESKPTSLPLPPPTRIGFGEYFHPALYNKPTLYGQLEFIRKIETLVPDVLVDLVESVRPAYEQLRTVVPESDLISLNSGALRTLAETRRNEFAPVLVALDTWTERWHLDADWARDMALTTLFGWTGTVIRGNQLKFAWPSISAANPLKPEEQLFSFSDYGWIVTRETRNEFVARIRAEFEFKLAGYVKRVDSKAKNAGWKKTPEIRQSAKGADLFRHFEWLVRWQVQKWTTTQIAAKYGIGNRRKKKSAHQSTVIAGFNNPASDSEIFSAEKDLHRKSRHQTVHDRLERAAELIDLPLRFGKKVVKKNLSK